MPENRIPDPIEIRFSLISKLNLKVIVSGSKSIVKHLKNNVINVCKIKIGHTSKMYWPLGETPTSSSTYRFLHCTHIVDR